MFRIFSLHIWIFYWFTEKFLNSTQILLYFIDCAILWISQKRLLNDLNLSKLFEIIILPDR